MNVLRCTLVTDGPSDGEMLVPILEWLLRVHCEGIGVNVAYADPSQSIRAPKGLAKKIAFDLEAYPCDYLFVHRDAEGDHPDLRRQEIQRAVEAVPTRESPPHLCVVPVRMTEAWLLFDEVAIRSASGNPNGKVPLEIPPLSRLEDKPDPKRLLHDLLITASELSGRRYRSFDARRSALRVARLLDDFSPLRQLLAFRALESDIQRIVRTK
jgi:hypothetical protein